MTDTQIPQYLSTRDAAKALMRQEATLYSWSHKGNGPIKPTRVHGRLVWSAVEIANLLKGGEGGQ